jgi:hypothetical protein
VCCTDASRSGCGGCVVGAVLCDSDGSLGTWTVFLVRKMGCGGRRAGKRRMDECGGAHWRVHKLQSSNRERESNRSPDASSTPTHPMIVFVVLEPSCGLLVAVCSAPRCKLVSTWSGCVGGAEGEACEIVKAAVGGRAGDMAGEEGEDEGGGDDDEEGDGSGGTPISGKSGDEALDAAACGEGGCIGGSSMVNGGRDDGGKGDGDDGGKYSKGGLIVGGAGCVQGSGSAAG